MYHGTEMRKFQIEINRRQNTQFEYTKTGIANGNRNTITNGK